MSPNKTDQGQPRPLREIRALCDDKVIRVYQAYSPLIAEPALKAQKFVPPFKHSRMTWIKPSFTWMMYRSGWAQKQGQEFILGIDILRTGFEWALAHSSLSHFDAEVHASHEEWETRVRESPVRIQWDPERSVSLQPLAWRAIQIGLGPAAVGAYTDDWAVKIEDVTGLSKKIHALVERGEMDSAMASVPFERPYPVSTEITRRIGAKKMPILSDAERARFLAGLADQDPIASLRKFAIDLSAGGLNQGAIYLRFLAYSKHHLSPEQEDKLAALGDVMDMIVDEYSPFNLNLPK